MVITVPHIRVNHQIVHILVLQIRAIQLLPKQLHPLPVLSGLDPFNEFLQLRGVLSATDHPVGRHQQRQFQKIRLFLSEVGVFTGDSLEEIPTRHLHIQVEVDASVFLQHQKAQQMAPLFQIEVLIREAILCQQCSFVICPYELAFAVMLVALVQGAEVGGGQGRGSQPDEENGHDLHPSLAL